jgi:hypothetical protein
VNTETADGERPANAATTSSPGGNSSKTRSPGRQSRASVAAMARALQSSSLQVSSL